VLQVFGFDPGLAQVREAAEYLSGQNRFDPILDYLDAVEIIKF
jgi:hypothetical protein